jgi:hypothetical protein
VYRVVHDWDDPEPLSSRIVRSVSAISGDLPTDVGPIQEVMNVDALDQLFEPTGDELRSSGMFLRFDVSDHDVTVYGDGLIVICPPDDERAETPKHGFDRR